MTATTATQNKAVFGKKMLISADDYQRMGRAGIFNDKPKVELIDGEIYFKNPTICEHNSHVDKASEFFIVKLFGKANVRTQGSIRTDEYSEPEPDINILKYNEQFYKKKQATAEDVLLVVEVAVSTLKRDRTIKKKKYATTGIPEYWIVIPKKGIVEVFRNLEEGKYLQKSTFKINDKWTFDTFDLAVNGSDLLIP